MISKVFAVLDTKVKAYMAPWLQANVPSGVRAFTDACLDENPSNQFRKHPHDFVLMELGEFDDSTGTFTTNEHGPTRVASAFEVLPPEITNPRDLFTKQVEEAIEEGEED